MKTESEKIGSGASLLEDSCRVTGRWTRLKRHRQSSRVRSRGTAIPEFACALCAFILFLFWPVLNLVSFFGAYGLVALMVCESAVQAVNCGTYSAARQSVRANARKIATSNLSRLFGIERLRLNLSVSCTDVRSGVVSYSRGDRAHLNRDDLTNKICDFVVELDCSIHPPVPITCYGLRDIPLIGKDVVLSCSARRQVERPELLAEEWDEAFFRINKK